MKRILIVGNWNTVHVRRFMSVLCKAKSDNLIIDAFDPNYEDGQENVCRVDHVFRVTASPLLRRIYSIRKIGTLLRYRKEHNAFSKVLEGNRYDLVDIHFLPKDTLQLVRIAHRHNVKVMLTPLGSDVLRLDSAYHPIMKKAFDYSDFVSANKITGFYQTVKDKFHIEESKFIDLGYGSETISAICEMRGKHTREELVRMIGAPIASYYICCGYNASSAQHQMEAVDAISSVRGELPQGFCLLFPLTYGKEKEYLYQKLVKKCQDLSLNSFFLTDFLTVEQVAALRLVTNLFIHIQSTDAYNASLQECLLSGAKVINGEWLKYPSLERHGVPYYLCSSVSTLSEDIKRIYDGTGPVPVLSREAVSEILSNSWSSKVKLWMSFYESV